MDHVVVAFTIGGVPILMKSTDEMVLGHIHTLRDILRERLHHRNVLARVLLDILDLSVEVSELDKALSVFILPSKELKNDIMRFIFLVRVHKLGSDDERASNITQNYIVQAV